MWYASLLAPKPQQATELRRAGAGRSSSAKAAASPIEMPSRSASQGRQGPRARQLQRVEAVQRHDAQAVDPADDRGVAHARRRSVRGARRTLLALEEQAVETTTAGPVQAERRAHEAGRARTGRACARSRSPRGSAPVRIALAIGLLAVENAGRAGAEHHGDPRRRRSGRAPLRPRRRSRPSPAQPGQPVVAAVEPLQAGRASRRRRRLRRGRSRSRAARLRSRRAAAHCVAPAMPPG